MTGADDLGRIDFFRFDDDAEFGMKIAPQQHRAKVTIENILQSTGELLEEQNFDNLSTSQICERAGLTPPALYRYFPNKYAIVMEMGQRILIEQHETYVRWIKAGGIKDGSRQAIFDSLHGMAVHMIDAIRSRPGGREMCQILRTLPALSLMRRRVREHSLDMTLVHLSQFQLAVSEVRARRVLNLLMEIFLVSIELIVDDDPEGATDATKIVCDMAANQVHKFVTPVSGQSGTVAH